MVYIYDRADGMYKRQLHVGAALNFALRAFINGLIDVRQGKEGGDDGSIEFDV